MAFTYAQILQAQFEDAQAERAQINADLEYARLAEDASAVNMAVERIYQSDAKLRTINDAAATMQRQAQNPQIDASFAGSDLKREQIDAARRYGLSADEMTVAVNATGDPHVSAEVAAQRYVEGKQRYQQWRASNKDERDFQGNVRR
jgi:hypothetical protein